MEAFCRYFKYCKMLEKNCCESDQGLQADSNPICFILQENIQPRLTRVGEFQKICIVCNFLR